MDFFNEKRKLKILFVSSEEAPFAKVGGLGEIMFSLPRALNGLGHDARVMIPRYGTIDTAAWKMPYVYEGLDVPTAPQGGGKRLLCNVRQFAAIGEPRSPVTTYFLENREYYELRSNIYGYKDDSIRFALLSRGCLEFLNIYKEWTPDIIVATDWMTGFVPNFLKTDYQNYTRLRPIATVLSIHNLSSQMARSHRFLPETEQDDGYGPIPDFFSPRMRDINSLKRGILYADFINTVSPTYAKEIMDSEFGEGLEILLREKQNLLYGILNGIDYETNDPATDKTLEKNFTSKTIHLRDENKLALQQKFGLPQEKEVFLMGIVSRLNRQKGFDLLEPVIEFFLRATKTQLVAVGEGDTEIMNFFHALETRFPDQVRVRLQFDESLPHVIYGGCDTVLVPSRFEPSGLTQMEAMRFGAIPIARRVGGLADTVEDYDPEKEVGTGFLFDGLEPNELLIALTRAHTSWRHRSSWKKMQKRAMEKDFSWDRSAREYVVLFENALKIHDEELKKSPE